MRSGNRRATKSSKKAAKPQRSKSGPAVSQPSGPAPESEGQARQVTLRLRPSLKKAIEAEARACELTVQALFLLGMRKLGLPVTEDDLRDGRKPGGASSKRATGAARASGRQGSGQEPAFHRGNPEQVVRLGLEAPGEQNLSLSGGRIIIVVSNGCKCE